MDFEFSLSMEVVCSSAYVTRSQRVPLEVICRWGRPQTFGPIVVTQMQTYMFSTCSRFFSRQNKPENPLVRVICDVSAFPSLWSQSVLALSTLKFKSC